MKITEKNRALELEILKYAFEDEDEADEYDRNLLTVSVICTENGEQEEYQDSCLYTFELEELRDGFRALLDKALVFESDFEEPSLFFEVIRRKEGYRVSLSFETYNPDGDEWKTVQVSEILDEEGMISLRNQANRWIAQFPGR